MTRHIGIVIYENAQPIDIIGPWEVLAIWETILKAPIQLHLIAEKEGFVELDSQITLKAHKSFNNAPQLDDLIVPGGRGRVQQMENQKLIDFIQAQAADAKYILSVCTGMFLLAKAGLLKNQSATTYWRALPELKEDKEIHVVEKRIVKSGKIWTSGGITSGIDLALAFIEEIAGRNTAGEVQLLLEYFPENKNYCSSESIHQLPPYLGSGENTLPQYIQDHIKKSV